MTTTGTKNTGKNSVQGVGEAWKNYSEHNTYRNKLSGLHCNGLSFWIGTLCGLVSGCQCF